MANSAPVIRYNENAASIVDQIKSDSRIAIRDATAQEREAMQQSYVRAGFNRSQLRHRLSQSGGGFI
jgi:hypothetical protein